MKTVFVLFILGIMTLVVFAQEVVKELEKNQEALNTVREEIESLKKQIAKTNIKSSSNLEQIKIIENELALLSKAKLLLRKESRLLKKKIDITRQEMKEREEKLKKLRTHYAQRVVHTYKYGRIQNLELLLGAKSFNTAMVRYKYLSFFAEQERRIVNKLRFEIERIHNLQENLNQDLQRYEANFKEKEHEQQKYLARKKEKNELIKQFKWTLADQQKRLKDAEQEYQRLYQIIVQLERQRRLREKKGEAQAYSSLNFKNFEKAKGGLSWPVNGSILHKYGKQKDPILKTTIKNDGIDIKAEAGSQVKAVFTGIVSMVTNLSGLGNTIILDHGSGYYTVYSHLDDIFVERDELIETGNIIGLVGDSGSLEGAKLHFAVFVNQRTENPQSWLR